MSPVFLDAGYLIALEAVRDQHHAVAVRHWREFVGSGRDVVTSTFVLDEVITYFTSRNFHAKAVQIGTRLLSSTGIELIHVDEEMFRTAFAYLQARADKRFSMTDCISFTLMRRLRIQDALAFDVHFEQAGFTRLPLPSR